MGAAMFLKVTIWRLFEYGGGRPSLRGRQSRSCGAFRRRRPFSWPSGFPIRLELDTGSLRWSSSVGTGYSYRGVALCTQFFYRSRLGPASNAGGGPLATAVALRRRGFSGFVCFTASYAFESVRDLRGTWFLKQKSRGRLHPLQRWAAHSAKRETRVQVRKRGRALGAHTGVDRRAER